VAGKLVFEFSASGARTPRQARGALSWSSLDSARDDPEALEGSKGSAPYASHILLVFSVSRFLQGSLYIQRPGSGAYTAPDPAQSPARRAMSSRRMSRGTRSARRGAIRAPVQFKRCRFSSPANRSRGPRSLVDQPGVSWPQVVHRRNMRPSWTCSIGSWPCKPHTALWIDRATRSQRLRTSATAAVAVPACVATCSSLVAMTVTRFLVRPTDKTPALRRGFLPGARDDTGPYQTPCHQGANL
jgi:hypothetical protein